MELNTQFNKNWRKWFLNDVVKAIETYDMIGQDDHICVALSGGKDSISLLFFLFLLTRYSHLNFSLSALHAKTADYDTSILTSYCSALEIPYFETLIDWQGEEAEEQPCYICSRLKRGAIAARLKEMGIIKAAYGHHADDVVETLLMNIAQNRKFGSFSPIVSVEDSQMMIIRPLVYLTEKQIEMLHSYFKLPLLDYHCPYEENNLRTVFKKGVRSMNSLLKIEDFSKKVVKSLENIDLTNIWPDMKKNNHS